MIKNSLLRKSKFWEYIPFNRYLIFISAIFFLFSGIGFIIDLLLQGAFSEELLAINVIYSGIVAVFYVYSFTKNLKFLFFTIIFQVVGGISIWSRATQPLLPDFPERAYIDAIGILVTLVLGYILLILFINKEGVRNLRIQAEMTLAQELHSNLVPDIEISNSYFKIFGISNPTDEVGGDLIDFIKNENSHTCYIADVSGHGVAAGSMMGMFKSTMRVLLNMGEPVKSILSETSKTIYDLKKKNMFLTCAVISFKSDNTAEFSTAGHLPILKLSNDSNNFDELIIKQLPIGATRDFVYKTGNTNWNKNDIFILLTDGVTETFNNNKEFFGVERVKEIILNHRNSPLSTIYEKIEKELVAYGKQIDDQSILLIKCL